MAKKKHRKKHQFKAAHVAPTSKPAVSASATDMGASEAQQTQATTSAAKLARSNRSAGALAGVDDFSYVTVELKRVLILAVCLVALEIVLWVIFRQTSIGPRVYELIKL